MAWSEGKGMGVSVFNCGNIGVENDKREDLEVGYLYIYIHTCLNVLFFFCSRCESNWVGFGIFFYLAS